MPNLPSRRDAMVRVAATCATATLCSPISAHSDGNEPEVRIGLLANITHAQALLAVRSGDFERAVAPARLTTQVFKAGPSVIEALFAGEIDVGYVGPSPALNAHLKSRGKGIRVISGAAANGVAIVARADSGIEKLEDLRDRRIATPQIGNTQDVSARHYVQKVLGQTNSENVVPIPNPEQVSMMARGKIDAAWAVEPWGALLIANAGARPIAEEKDLWAGGRFALTLVAVDPEFLEKRRDLVRRLLEVHLLWTDRLCTAPATYIPDLCGAMLTVTGRSLPERVISDALGRVVFTHDPLRPSLKAFAQWAYELGRVRGIPKVDTLVDTALVDSIKKHGAQPADTATPAGGKVGAK